jgi:hypothetical protein
LNKEFHFDFDPCPYPVPPDFDGLDMDWGKSNYVNPPFFTYLWNGKKTGPTAWMRKALEQQAKGKDVVIVYPLHGWIHDFIKAASEIRNLGRVRWIATEDPSQSSCSSSDIACFVLRGKKQKLKQANHDNVSPNA